MSIQSIDDGGALVAGQGQAVEAFVPQRSSFDLRHLVGAVRTNYRLIVALIVGALALALVITLLQTPRYTGVATIQINSSSGHLLRKGADDEGGDEGRDDADRFLNTQVDVLKSKGLALRVARKLNLANKEHFFEAERASVPKPGTAPEKVEQSLVSILRNNLEIKLPHDTRIASISFESADPQLSALIANTYADEFIKADLQRRFDASSYAREFLSQQLEVARQRLEQSERAVNDYARNNSLIIAQPASGQNQGQQAGNTSVTTSSLLQINAAVNDATARRIAAEAHWKAVSASALMSVPEVIGNGTVAQLVAQRAALQADLELERSRHLDDYPTVKAKRAQLVQLESQIHIAAMNVRNSIKADYDTAAKTEKDLLAKVAGLKSETLEEQQRTVQYNLLAHETEANRQVYDGLLDRFKELNALAGASLSNVSVIDVATVPSLPTSPSLMKNLLIGAIIGLVLAVVVVFIKDQFDDSIRVPEDLETKLELRQLGVIPKQASASPLEMLSDPKSSMSEAYNSLRGVLLYSTPKGLPQIVQITSAQPSEGKSTSAFALALGIARLSKSVLLIDADLRRPSLHRAAELDNERGLSTVLTGQMSLADAVSSGLHANLTLLPSGPIPPNPAEILSTSAFEILLQEAAARYDFILIDSPPVVGLADAPLIAPLVDGVIFIVEADRSRRGALKLALRRLRAMKPIVLGGVLTKFDPMKAGADYYDYYGYSYYQYQYGPKPQGKAG
ncbi:MAG TPA: polysaccharide biosynthesis tyrosine autokinase [Novosphingobium sp.]|nr:polysaccharide biosynthesis tyrosine autokinase [Novosphingobium sp.]